MTGFADATGEQYSKQPAFSQAMVQSWNRVILIIPILPECATLHAPKSSNSPGGGWWDRAKLRKLRERSTNMAPAIQQCTRPFPDFPYMMDHMSCTTPEMRAQIML
jgi:hypothetical protein